MGCVIFESGMSPHARFLSLGPAGSLILKLVNLLGSRDYWAKGHQEQAFQGYTFDCNLFSLFPGPQHMPILPQTPPHCLTL